MKGRKAMGPDCIPIEVWKGLGDIAIVWLTKLFNLFKNKGVFRVVLITVELN